MHILYDPSTARLFDFLDAQTGRGVYSGMSFQRGRGGIQRGNGFGKILTSLMKNPQIRQLGKSIRKVVKKEGLESGRQFLSDVMSGENVLDSAKTRLLSTGKNLANRALRRLEGIKALPGTSAAFISPQEDAFQTGSGLRRPCPKSTRPLIGRRYALRPKSNSRRDIFGDY